MLASKVEYQARKFSLTQSKPDNLLQLAIHGHIRHRYVYIFIKYSSYEVSDGLSILAAFNLYQDMNGPTV